MQSVDNDYQYKYALLLGNLEGLLKHFESIGCSQTTKEGLALLAKDMRTSTKVLFGRIKDEDRLTKMILGWNNCSANVQMLLDENKNTKHISLITEDT